MLFPKLFVGFVKDAQFEKELRSTNPYLIDMLTKDKRYLRPHKVDQTHYLGKFLNRRATIEEIENTETHILSLLYKLTPHYPFDKSPLVVISV